MIIFKLPGEFSSWLEQQRAIGKTVGFAPTMGALHEGHISLIHAIKDKNDLAVSSIFINPTQFNNASDFEKYPVSIEQDVLMLAHAGCDAVLIPSVLDLYPKAVEKEHFELGEIENILEGEYRPRHFQGVCQVVKKLLVITNPTCLYLGQKDFQQCLIIRKLLQLMNLNTELIIAPTIREVDGLAMSSRNRRLNADQRSKAPGIYQALTYIKNNLQHQTFQQLKTAELSKLSADGFKVDYLQLADTNTLHILEDYKGSQPSVILLAAYLDDIRLIDNILV